MPVRLLNEKDVRALAPDLPEVVALVEQAYRLEAEGKAEVPTKIGVHPGHGSSLLHAMPAWVGETRALGMKWISYFPDNIERALPAAAAIIVLNDPEHGRPCCIMEGLHVTFLRTAACAAVAAKHLALRPPRALGLIGCGGLGLWSLRTMIAMFPSIEQVYVSSRTRRSREAFCAQMSTEVNRRITPIDEPGEAVRAADIVVTSIPPGTGRPVAASSFMPGTLLIPLDLVSAWQDEVLALADPIAADNPEDFCARIQARRPTALSGLKPPVRLQDAVAGKLPRASPSERTLIAICGIASTDIVVASAIYRRACAENVGMLFDLHG
jgi:ornithine cyclodeaminase/alanine dehydrogenase-like protein (mu-crystallin family)